MPRKSEITTANLVDTLTELHGVEVDTIQVRNVADSLGVSYATACKRLDSYKSGRGKWNLTAQEIEQAYEAPSAISSVNYIPEKDDSYVQFGNFQSVKKLYSLVSSIRSLSRVFLAMVKPCPLSKRVLQRSGS